MSDIIYLERNAGDMLTAPAFEPYSRVNINVAKDLYYTAGDDTGRALEISCPWGTQAMADNLLAAVEGFIYQPFEASDALLDPAAELGDDVRINGLESMLLSRSVDFGGLCLASIAAPGEEEIDHEYPYLTKSQRDIERQIATVRATLTVDIDRIAAEVAGKIDEEEAQTLIEASLGGLNLSVSTGSTSSTLTLKSGETTLDSANITFTGFVTFNALSGAGQTTINGGNITTGTINASRVTITNLDADNITSGELSANYIRLGGQMEVYRALSGSGSSTVGGYVGYCAGYSDTGIGVMNTSSTGQCICTNAGARLAFGSVSGVVAESGGSLAFRADGANKMTADSSALRPASTGGYYLGLAAYHWGRVYTDDIYIYGNAYNSSGSVVHASDRRLKHDINYDVDAYEAFFDALKPCRFKYNSGTSDRYHVGLIAQDVYSALLAAGLDGQDFGGYVANPVHEDPDDETSPIVDYTLMIRDGEFVGLLVQEVQRLKIRIAALEAAS